MSIIVQTILFISILNEELVYAPQKNVFVIFSDVDDTIVCNTLGGEDRSLPNHTVYPGVLELQAILTSNLLILSARPNALLTGTEGQFKIQASKVDEKNKQVKKWSNLVIKYQNNNSDLTQVSTKSYSGKKRNLLKTIFSTDWAFQSMGIAKQNSIKNFHEEFQSDINNKDNYRIEGKFIILFGDNGQGDLITSMKCLIENKIDQAFIHRIKQSVNEIKSKKAKKIKDTFNKQSKLHNKIIFFDNYLELIQNIINGNLNFIKLNNNQIQEMMVTIDKKIEKLCGKHETSLNIYQKPVVKQYKVYDSVDSERNEVNQQSDNTDKLLKDIESCDLMRFQQSLIYNILNKNNKTHGG